MKDPEVFWAPRGVEIEDHSRATGWFFWDEDNFLNWHDSPVNQGPFETERAAINAHRNYTEALAKNAITDRND